MAVSPVMPLSCCRIAVIRLGGTPIAFASAAQRFQKILVEDFIRS
jgi:hypothetical protein